MRPIFAAWGGGNQWLLQTARYLQYCGYHVQYDLRGEVDAIVMNHGGLTGKLSIPLEAVQAYKTQHPTVAVLHRVNDNDVRKKTHEMDARLARFDAVADHTVFISEWLRNHHSATWFDPARTHSCILNGADPAVFHPIGNRPWRAGEPFRIVTHHWSDNWMKGFAAYREIDEAIAAGKLPGVELWIVGRWPKEIAWRAARTFPPANGSALADLLRQCHAYVTASLQEPGGMHFIEGLQCGLPVIYHEDGGGIVELAGQYGLGFRDDVIGAVTAIRERYVEFREKLLQAGPSGDGMCIRYREVIQQALAQVR
ncbi:MAG TPA: glycosyltransferase [Chthoniobacteraceae bacterium]|nr:glycosyltransferase [Chthoniobacteraceae bacterium]